MGRLLAHDDLITATAIAVPVLLSMLSWKRILWLYGAACGCVIVVVVFCLRRYRYRSEVSRPEARYETDLADRVLEESAAPSVAEPLPSAFEGLLLRRFLSRNECVALIAAAEECGFGTAQYDKEYRGNLRLMTVDANLSAALWARLRPHLTAEVTCALDHSTWRADGLCETWKWSKYLPQPGRDAFAPHVDGTHWPEPSLRSFYSLNVYLNDDFAAGRTRFYRNPTSDEVVYTCQPEQGLALVFRQPPSAKYLHDGEAVRDGAKYLWRCDVMYRKV